MNNVIVDGDQAIGHTDILGNNIVGIISSNSKAKVSDKSIAISGNFVNFPSHPHSLVLGEPSNYRSHSIEITGSGKGTILTKEMVVHGDLVLVSDEAGGNASMISSQSKLKSN